MEGRPDPFGNRSEPPAYSPITTQDTCRVYVWPVTFPADNKNSICEGRRLIGIYIRMTAPFHSSGVCQYITFPPHLPAFHFQRSQTWGLAKPRGGTPVLHMQNMLLGAQGWRARPDQAAVILDPLQDAINVLQPIFLRFQTVHRHGHISCTVALWR